LVHVTVCRHSERVGKLPDRRDMAQIGVNVLNKKHQPSNQPTNQPT